MRVVILGCGRVGARLAGMLDAESHKVSVIDTTLEAFERLPASFSGKVVLGEGVDYDILREAGIERADAFVAATQGDNRNIMASQIAKHLFGVKNVVTRVYDPLRADTFATLGLRAISPTLLGANRFFEEVTGEPAQQGRT